MKKTFSLLMFVCLWLLNVNGQIVNVSSNYRVRSSAPFTCSGDADFAKVVDSLGITADSNKQKVCWLIDTLKTTNIWTKARVINPVFGGTAATHKWNWKDVRNLDAAYRLVFNGTLTHSATGMLPNGSTGYANTFFNGRTVWTDSLGSIGIYSRTSQASGTFTEMGAANGAFTENLSIFTRFGDLFYGLANTSDITNNVSNTNSIGWFFTSRVARTGSNNAFIQKNGTQTQFSSANASLPPNLSLYVGALNSNGSAANFSSKEITFVWIGDKLTTAEATTLYNIVSRWNAKTYR